MRLVSPLLGLLVLSAGSLTGCSGDKGGTDSGVVDAQGLQLAFDAPTDGSWYAEGDAVPVSLTITDSDGGSVDGLSLVWTGAATDADAPGTTDADGSASFTLDPLDVGVYAIGVQASRGDGAVGTATVAFEIVDPDQDNDGFQDSDYGGDDCDDEDPTTNPAADEFCDGDDNDCDGEIDEEDAVDIPTWYLDLDEDGYGDADEVTVDCQQPKDTVLVPGDCDDDDDAINPGAAEVCDGVDNDCDGDTDDEDLGLETASASVWYPDEDGDLWGDYSEFLLACEAPDGWVADGGDCDDGDPDVNPGVPEICDGLDNNCMDGVDDDSAVDAPTWYADEDMDDWGVDGETTTACDQPTGFAAELGDCDDADETINPDAVEICNDGVDNDCDDDWQGCEGDLVADATAALLGESSLDEAAYDLALLDDIDGDGIGDLLLGARSTDFAADDAGSAYIVRGPIEGELDLSDAWLRLDGPAEGTRAGRRVAAGGDLTGDGVEDMLISAPNVDGSSFAEGAVYLIDGSTLSSGTASLSDQAHVWTGEARYDYLGVGLAVADLTGDGAADALMSSSAADVGASNTGAFYLFEGPISDGSTDLADGTWDARIAGDAGGERIGQSVDARGDIDGDGQIDLIIGAATDATVATDAGSVAVLTGPITGELDLSDAAGRIYGEAGSDQLGALASTLPDLDGDGYDELLIGAPGVDGLGLDAGAAWIVYGSAASGALDGSIGELAAVTIEGADTNHNLGVDGDGWGDHDGDGAFDLLLGAPGAGPDAGGAVHLFLGPLSGSYVGTDAEGTWYGDSDTDGVGRLVRFGGDLADVDGTFDGDTILAGARAADLAGTDSGALFLIGWTGL